MHITFFRLTYYIFVLSSFSFSQEYYPLEIGNVWTYHYNFWSPPPYSDAESYTFSIKVEKDTILSDGEKYFLLSRYDLTESASKLVRADSNYICYFIDSLGIPFYNLNAEVGEGWSATYNSVELIEIDTINFFNIYTKTLQFTLDGLSKRDITISENFGPISYRKQDYGYTDIDLVGCVISKVVYGDTITGIVTRNFPNFFSLSQNFPNPFNSTTIIEYHLPSFMNVKIELYNSLGQLISLLYSGRQNAGRHRVVLEAGSLSTGIYFYKLSTTEFSQVRKCLLIK